MKKTGLKQEVKLSGQARKQLKKLPRHIVENLAAWVDDVESRGISAVRTVPGFHDEPLKGKRVGQRSIRLSRAYRAIYSVREGEADRIILIEEVTKHEY